MRIRTTKTGFDHCATEARKRGYVLRDARQTTLDGSGFTLMPEAGGRLRDLRRFSNLGQVVEALEALPVLAGDRVRATSTNPCSEIPLPTAATRRLSPR